MKDHFVMAVIANTLTDNLPALGSLITIINPVHNTPPVTSGHLALESVTHSSGNVIDACVGTKHPLSGDLVFVGDSA